jgi:chromosome segregation ATPase
MDLSPGAHIENHGTIMHIEADAVSDVTIVQHGTIMNASGCTIIKGNGSGHSDAVKVMIREVPRQSDLQHIEELEKECARLRAQMQNIRENKQPADNDIYWGRKRIKEQKQEIDRLKVLVGTMKAETKQKDETIGRLMNEVASLRNKDIIRRLDSENESLKDRIAYTENTVNELRCEVADLHEQLAGTDRPQLLKTIEDLKDKLKRSRNREEVQKQRADHESMRNFFYNQKIWDDYRPTKEEVKTYYKTIRNLMDCETDF